MKQFAVVILNWNGEKLLQQFLPSVLQYSPEATIYVADNASTDHSIAYIQKHFPSITIIKNKGNFGFAKGYNEALQTIEEPYLALVNSDIEVTKNWLTTPTYLFDNEPNTAIIQPKILDFKNKKKFEYAGAAGGYIDKWGFPYCRGRIFDTLEDDNGQYNQESTIFWASGACFFIRNTIYKQHNGFDTHFFAHQEEIDLCWRVNNNGYDIKYTPQSTVYHVGGATLTQNNPYKTYLNFRNSLWMLLKNVPSQQLFYVLFVRMCLDGIAAFAFLLQKKPKLFAAVLKAHFHFYAKSVFYYQQRESNQQKNYYQCSSIVWSYFIQNKKYYKHLF